LKVDGIQIRPFFSFFGGGVSTSMKSKERENFENLLRAVVRVPHSKVQNLGTGRTPVSWNEPGQTGRSDSGFAAGSLAVPLGRRMLSADDMRATSSLAADFFRPLLKSSFDLVPSTIGLPQTAQFWLRRRKTVVHSTGTL
jgi:hypothetical protein